MKTVKRFCLMNITVLKCYAKQKNEEKVKSKLKEKCMYFPNFTNRVMPCRKVGLSDPVAWVEIA